MTSTPVVSIASSTLPTTGGVASKKGKLFGLRLHVTATTDQLIDEWLLAPAFIPDPQALDGLVDKSWGLILIGDEICNDAQVTIYTSIRS